VESVKQSLPASFQCFFRYKSSIIAPLHLGTSLHEAQGHIGTEGMGHPSGMVQRIVRRFR